MWVGWLLASAIMMASGWVAETAVMVAAGESAVPTICTSGWEANICRKVSANKESPKMNTRQRFTMSVGYQR